MPGVFFFFSSSFLHSTQGWEGCCSIQCGGFTLAFASGLPMCLLWHRTKQTIPDNIFLPSFPAGGLEECQKQSLGSFHSRNKSYSQLPPPTQSTSWKLPGRLGSASSQTGTFVALPYLNTPDSLMQVRAPLYRKGSWSEGQTAKQKRAHALWAACLHPTNPQQPAERCRKWGTTGCLRT